MSCEDSEDTRTIYCANLASKVTEEILYELFLQAGPLERVHIPVDREGRLAAYGFVTFKHQCSVDYAIRLFEDIHLYNCRLVLRPRKKQDNSEPNQQSLSYLTPSPPQPQVVHHVMSSKYNSLTPMYNQNRIPCTRNDYRNNEHYRNESLQGRFQNFSSKRGRDIMRPNDNHGRNYKRHKRQGNLQ